MFTIDMLPAEYGDCLWVEFGPSKRPKRILIDAGTKKAYSALRKRIESLPRKERIFELLVVTHVDVDHIGGILPLLDEADSLGVVFKDIWFNGYGHIERATDHLGGIEGEQLSARLLRRQDAWNRAFRRAPIVIGDKGRLPTKEVAGMTITLLSPGVDELERLKPVWKETVEKAGLVPGVEVRRDEDEIDDLLGEDQIDIQQLARSKFIRDTAEPNGSSIAFVASFGGKGVLFGADAFPGLLAKNVRKLPKHERNAIRVLKVPHHGSRRNISNELLELLSCQTFLISTNGRRFSHPNREAIARLIQRGRGANLKFNYRTEFNRCWNDRRLKKEFGFTTEYGGVVGLSVRC